jgi:hypothetical protein
MDNRDGFHSKKIYEARLSAERLLRQSYFYDEKDTPLGKRLQRIVVFRRNVTFFARDLSKRRCN